MWGVAESCVCVCVCLNATISTFRKVLGIREQRKSTGSWAVLQWICMRTAEGLVQGFLMYIHSCIFIHLQVVQSICHRPRTHLETEHEQNPCAHKNHVLDRWMTNREVRERTLDLILEVPLTCFTLSHFIFKEWMWWMQGRKTTDISTSQYY